MAQHVVLTGVANPTHLVYAASYLRTLAAAGERVTVVSPPGRIDIEAPANRGLLPGPEQIELRVEADWTCPPDAALTYVAVGAPGLKPYARLRKANPRKQIHVVVTDEGLGTYGTWRTRRVALARQRVREPWRSIRSAAVAGGARWLTGTRWPLYVRRGAEWSVQDQVAAEFRRHVPGRDQPDARRVVLLTQPWIELGTVTERTYLAQVERLAEQTAQVGGELVVRAHPSEPRGRYAALGELDTTGPAELDPAVVGAATLIGGPSTALLNLAAVHQVPVVRVGVPGRAELDDDLSDAQATLLDTFLGPVVPDDQVHQAVQLG